ncbi:uncharacterized protein C5L36_0B06180 [Pichia kudriavzevii]|uniref:Knr4/Smi1-like domain-containing protein n=1 Tax=Pichia kudriavzevii TaxID=4909 RepID=A0A2U9R286_PICKU|nr:uncharacterized protein C5L36_0B06180 [Pichia kudriavzevii]AWU75371.1 hypothetical protein C5L36_0B06180 [Pichia kudriavzevii]
MSIFRNIKEFFHNITTNDHYAQYGSNDKKGKKKSSNRSTPTGSKNGSSVSLINKNNKVNSTSVSDSKNSTSSNADNSNSKIPYRPGMRSQLHNDSQIELRNYENGQPQKDIVDIWEAIDDWLDREFPELADDIQGGATANDLNAFEDDLDINLPAAFRDSYQIHDGQVSMGKTRGLVFSYPLMDLESIAAETNIWRKVYEKFEKKDASVISSAFGPQSSCPPKYINEIYYDPLWIPFVKDNVGNNIAIDLNPNAAGKWGQVILFGRDYNTKFVVAESFGEFLNDICEELSAGHFEIDDDEDLNYVRNGKNYNYFDVLRSKSISRAKKLDPSFTVNEEKNVNDAELLVQKSKSLNIKSEDTPVNTSNITKSSHIAETLISPANEDKKAFLPSKENVATNDSFVIDDDVPSIEENAEEPAVEAIAETVEEPAVESAPEHVTETVEENAEEPAVEAIAETVEEPAVESAPEHVAETAEEPTAEEPTAEEPTAEEHVAETVDEPAVEEPVTETADEPVVESAPEHVAETAEEPTAEEPTAEEPVAETVDEPAVEATPEPVDEPATESTEAAEGSEDSSTAENGNNEESVAQETTASSETPVNATKSSNKKKKNKKKKGKK